MKRFFIIGVIGFAAVVILMMGALLAVLVTPARAQVGALVGQAVERAQALAAAPNLVANASAQAQAPGTQRKDEKGILIAGVFTDSPADKAGLVRGDIILEAAGKAVNTSGDLSGILSQHKAGDTLDLLVQHGDTQKTVTVTLAEQPGGATSGATSAQATPQGTPQGTPQAVQPNQPNRQKSLLKSGPYLGIVPIGAGEFGLRVEKFSGQPEPGARITQVATGSPAEKAGLKVGEIITAVDGTAVDAQNSLGALITQHKAGDTVRLSVQGTGVQGAQGTTREVSVTLADHPQQAGTAYLGVSTGGFGRGGRFGVPGQDLPSLPGMPGEQQGTNPHNFNIPGLAEHPGAMLQQVTQDSPAEKAGLKAGQIIEAVDGKKLDSPEALSDAISAQQPGDTVTLTVYDPGTDQSSDVAVTLGENPQKAGAAWLGIQYGFFDFQNLPQQTPGSGG
jgi:S1-C subfamily serine protease